MEKLDQRTREALARITDKEIPELIPEDIAFLKARVAYLTGDQKEKFSEVLTAPAPEVPAPAPVVPSDDEVIAEAKALGLVTDGRTREELLLDIQTVKGPTDI